MYKNSMKMLIVQIQLSISSPDGFRRLYHIIGILSSNAIANNFGDLLTPLNIFRWNNVVEAVVVVDSYLDCRGYCSDTDMLDWLQHSWHCSYYYYYYKLINPDYVILVLFRSLVVVLYTPV